MNAVSNDLRRNTRAPIAVCAWIDFRGETKSRGMTSVDLSVDGARFISMRPVTEGDLLIIRLQLHAAGEPVECKARVSWNKRLPSGLHQFAVRFLDLCDDERDEIQALVDGYFTRGLVFSLAV
ncbi:MAG: hypothetical protein AMXMBFR84_19630 [Candidatus Hydrogenedentota bacterium]